MLRNFIRLVLHCRLEDVMAAGFSATLLIFFLTTRIFVSFHLNGQDIVFILLPAGILGVKFLLKMLSASDSRAGDNLDTGKYLVSFFKPLVKIVRDWFPFLLLSACYYSLYTNLVLRVNPHTADAFLSKIDAAILGNQPSFLLEPLIRPWLTDFLDLVYFSHIIFFPVVALYFYLKRQEKMFRRLMMGYLTLFLMGIASYILVPAKGPEAFFAGQYTRDLNGHALVQSVDYIFRVGHVAFDCFPSLHVGIPLLLAFYLRDYRKKLFIPVLIYVAFMCLATIYLRFHYLIDVIAAFAYAPAAYFLNDFLLSRWPGERILSATHQTMNEKAPAQPEGGPM